MIEEIFDNFILYVLKRGEKMSYDSNIINMMSMMKKKMFFL